MAPIKKLKTYNPSMKSLVNNSVDAGKILFHKSKSQGKRRKKLLIKELPPRTGQTLLGQDSFHISTEDTFDKLLKGNNYNVVNIKSHISILTNTDSNLSKSIKRFNKFYSPVMTRSKKRAASVVEISSSANLSNKENTSGDGFETGGYSSAENVIEKDRTDSLLRRLKEPTVDKIDFSLEVEKVRDAAPNSSSYIMIPEIKCTDMSINSFPDNPSTNNVDVSFEPIFTKTFRENQLIHSSTPLAPKQSKKIINYTMSPIKNVSSITENFIHSDNYSLTPLKQSQVLNIDTTQGKKHVSFAQSPSISEKRPGKLSRTSFITLRKRKVLKNKILPNKSVRKPKDNIDNTKSIEERNDSALNGKVSKEKEPIVVATHNLQEFELFEAQNRDLMIDNDYLSAGTSINFVNRRRRKLTDSILIETKKPKIDYSDSDESNSLRQISLQENSSTQCPRLTMKDVVVFLPQVNISEGSSIATISSDTSTDLRTSSNESDVLLDNDFFQLKNPIFKNLAIDVTRLNFTLPNSATCTTNGSIESLHNDSESLFDSCGNAEHGQTLDNKETVKCSLIDQKEILNVIKKSIGSDIPSRKNSRVSFEVDNVSNSSDKNVQMPSEIQISDNKVQSDYAQVSAEDIDEIYRNVTKRSQSSKRSDLQTFSNSERFSFDDNVNRELVVNVTRSPWRKDRRSSTKSGNNAKDTVVDLTDSFEQEDIGKSTGSDLKDAELQQFRKHSMSDIIESSVLESSQVDDDGFKIPFVNNPRKRQSKTLVLKAGKLWRRSLSMYKKSGIILSAINESACKLSNGNFCVCPKCNIARQSLNLNNRRLSIRIVPAKNSCDNRRKVSILENYAHNTSYVSDRILEDNLENDLRSLSLSKKKNLSIVQNSVPITARELVLKRCGQEEPLPFEECYPKSALQNCQKIGEGVYGEVFLFKNPSGGTSVIKIIPIEGDLIVNGERQKKFEEILSEITIALELSNLRNNKENKTSGFAEVQKVCCVQGCYPQKLLDLWDLYDETRGSENDSPEIFGEEQLYIVLQLANGGKDLEAFVFNNALQAYTMFQQVACTLAVAEEELGFEHRDLHWGNVLLSLVDRNSKVTFRVDGKNYDIMTKGAEVSIIDFTLSRIECDGVVIFNDLSLDPELFTAEGDYQFEVYKLMQKKNGNNWQRFEPFSNVLWLHYILDKAIAALRYKSTHTKVHKEYLGKLRQLKDDILNYNSVKEFVTETF